MNAASSRIEASYDRIAKFYAEHFFDELRRKPFDRELLDRFAEALRGRGMVCDIGCGPGHVARHLHEAGLDVCGIDLSAEMVKHARRLNPQIAFDRGDMTALAAPDAAYAGIAAFYSIIHLPREQARLAIAEMRRVLRPEGKLLLAFHGGEGVVHSEEWFGEPISIDATFFELDEMRAIVEEAGFEIEEAHTREPYEFEYQSRRVYILGRRP